MSANGACGRLGIVLAPLALVSACSAPERGDWRFAASEWAYEDLFEKMDANEPLIDADGLSSDGREWDVDNAWFPVAMAAILALPLAVDIALLPVTIPHDLCSD